MFKQFRAIAAFALSIFAALGLRADMPEGVNRTAPPTAGGDKAAIVERATRRAVLNQARAAAAARTKAALKAKGGKVDPAKFGVNPAAQPGYMQAKGVQAPAAKGEGAVAVPGPGFQLAQPDYMFGTATNWHNTKPIMKFVDTLPGLGPGNANNLGNYIPVAVPDTTTYAGSDYYEIDVVEYKQKLHSELNPTTLRGYIQHNAPGVNTLDATKASNYLGPVIIAEKDRPVRVKMRNMLPTGTAGDLFIPVDTTMMGSGTGQSGVGLGTVDAPEVFTQNRVEFHLHGGLNPWISDGTPHQWVTPAGEVTSYKKGAVFQNVPDMSAGANDADGIATYFWTNQQSARMLWYHDHAYGLTRLNAYVGQASGYLIVDPTEKRLINSGILPNNGGGLYNFGIPLIIQDKTFVDTTTLGTLGVMGGTDPTWSVAKYGGDGNLWYPHVYMPNQNPADISGANAMGRWDYGPWFWPPLTTAAGLHHGAEPVPGDPNGTEIPGTPNPSLTPEAFMDTPVINGAAYPRLTLEPKAYRFRILNGANDRFWSLSWFQADTTQPDADGRLTEVKMVPSAPNAAWPATWPTDGRAGGVPDPATAGPSFIQIGNESGFLPAPVVIAPQPVAYNYNRRDIVVLNIQDKGLLLGPAERADVIVDFSAFAGKSLILYNDAPAPVPAFDARLDYYTGAPDQRDSGGANTTAAGYGPNTRTLMLVEVAAATPAATFDMVALNTAFQSTPTSQGAFAESQHLPIVPQSSYFSALNKAPYTGTATNASFANDVYVRIQDQQFRYKFPSMENGALIQPLLEPKAIQELFELDYGRMNATLGVELPRTNFNNQTTIPLGYIDPATEIMTDGTTQFWKITHNGVDTHPVHFHLFDVQIVNRVGWDGAVRMPEANELGWKETVKMNPLEDIIVAMRPLSPRLPFVLPLSSRELDVTQPANAIVTFTDMATGNPMQAVNAHRSFGWEYVWHCHILGHEENDFMRPLVLNVATTVPAAASALTATSAPGRADLAWTDNSSDEVRFLIQRRAAGTSDPFVEVGYTVPNVWAYSDYTVAPGSSYDYQVVAWNQAGEGAPSNIAGLNTPTTVQATGVITAIDGTTTTPLANVVLTFSNGGGTATTDATGAYTAALPYAWTGTITPALAGFVFTPSTRSFTNLTTNQTGQDFQARPVVTLSGTVTVGGAPLAGVVITYSNGGGTATTDAAGAYSIVMGKGYAGTATPAKAGYIFTPAALTYTNVAADTTAQDFAATAVVVVSGSVLNGTTPVPGVTITFTNGGGTTTTDAAGAYTMTLNSPWTGTVTPSKVDFAFTPGSRSYTAITTDQAAQNFAASAIVIISGNIANGATALPGVTVAASTGETAITDANGAYTFTLPAPYTGTMTPALANYAFTPASRSYAAVSVDQTAQNYAATPVVTVSGSVLAAGAGVSGATVTFSTGQVLTTGVSGTYTLTLPAPYTGTITAAKPGYFLAPLSIAITAAMVDQPNQNFTAVGAVMVMGVVTTNTVPSLPLGGVTMTFSGGAGVTTTAANGTYALYVPAGWSGSITPTLAGYVFTPALRNLTNVITMPASQNFVGGAVYAVSGQVTSNGTGLAGVLVSFSNGAGSVTTDVNGFYTRDVRAGWTGTITPTLRGRSFSPVRATITTPLAGPLTQNFITTQTIGGRAQIRVAGQNVGLAGVTITLSTGGSVVTDANGNFTLTVPSGWTGSLSAADNGAHVWTPVSFSYTTLVTNVTGLRFNGL